MEGTLLVEDSDRSKAHIKVTAIVGIAYAFLVKVSNRYQ